MTTITYAEDQTYESAFMAIQRLIHAGNPGQTITIARHHIDRDGKWFTVTVEPYETQAQASHPTPDGREGSVGVEGGVCAESQPQRQRLTGLIGGTTLDSCADGIIAATDQRSKDERWDDLAACARALEFWADREDLAGNESASVAFLARANSFRLRILTEQIDGGWR